MDLVYENLLGTDYKQIQRLLKRENDVVKICQREQFWNDKYLRDFGPPKAEAQEWSEEYKMRYTITNPKKLFYLVKSEQEESEPIATIKAKNRFAAYKFIAYLCNNDLISKQYIQELVTQYKDPMEVGEELILLCEEYIEKGKFPVYMKRENIINCVKHYYLKPNYLYYKYDADDNKYILDLFRHLYLKQYGLNCIKEPFPDKITKPYLIPEEIEIMLNNNECEQCIELVEEEYYVVN